MLLLNMQFELDLLKRCIVKLLAKNAKIKAKNAKVKAENAKLKQAIKENKIRFSKLE
jgi:cell division protein FtsB